MSDNYDWLDEDFGFDEESDRVVPCEDSMVAPVPPIPGLEGKYEDVHISFSGQTFYGISRASGMPVEIPRSEWMSEGQYRSWLAAGSPKQIHHE